MMALLIPLLLLLSGCGPLFRGTMLDGTVCWWADDISARQRVANIIAIMPESKEKASAQMALELSGMTAENLCLLGRSLEGQVKKGGGHGRPAS
jgi:hypothetical protein